MANAEQLTSREQKRLSPERRERRRAIARRITVVLSRGSVSLQRGAFEDEDDLERRRRNIEHCKF